MILSTEIKQKITDEYNSFCHQQYGHLTKAERKQLGAFYTPPAVTIKMLEQLSNLDGSILDPCCGSGNLLIACIIAGADPNKVYGNELNAEMVELAKNRLEKYGVPREHIHQGNALCLDCLTKESFSSEYVYTEEMANCGAEKRKRK